MLDLIKNMCWSMRLFFILSMMLVLPLGCTHHQASIEQKVCYVGCKQKLEACNQVCHNDCQQCSSVADHSAVTSYNRYKHEQCVQGGAIIRELQSYRDPLQCRKITCGCRADYRVCMQSCSGIIRKRLQVSPLCC